MARRTPWRVLVLALGILAAGCAGAPQPAPLEPSPELRAQLAGLDRAGLVERMNRLLSESGQAMLRATPGCLVQDYWYIKTQTYLYRMPELASMALPWGDIGSATMRCQGEGPCDLRLQGPLAYQYLEALSVPSRRAALDLAALAGALARAPEPAPPCAVSDRDASLKYESSL